MHLSVSCTPSASLVSVCINSGGTTDDGRLKRCIDQSDGREDRLTGQAATADGGRHASMSVVVLPVGDAARLGWICRNAEAASWVIADDVTTIVTEAAADVCVCVSSLCTS